MDQQKLKEKEKKEEEEEGEEKPKKKSRSKKIPPSTDPLDGISFKDRRPYLQLDEPIPIDISLALSDRDDTQIDIISFICYHLLKGTCEFTIPKWKNLIIDGHCLTLEKSKILGVGIDQKYKPKDDLEAYSTPIIIQTDGKLSWATYLKNEIGESDFSIFFLYDKICGIEKKMLGLDIYSVDTDMMFLSLIYLHKKGLNCGEICWRFEPGPSWVLNIEFVPNVWPNFTESWVDIRELYNYIKEGCFIEPQPKPPKINKATGKPVVSRKKAERTKDIISFINLKNPVVCLVVAFFTAGGDYIDKFPLFGHEAAFTALQCYSNYIGDLITEDRKKFKYGISTNGIAYARFVKSCFIIQRNFKNEKGEAIHPKMTVEEINKMLPQTKGKKQTFIPHEKIMCHARHLQYYLSLVFQIGTCSKLDEPDPLLYSYAKIDESKELSRTNIKRVFC